MPTPEQLAREEIDGQLRSAGWIVQDRSALNIEDGSNLPEPDELAEEMILDLQNALEFLAEVAQVVTKRPADG